MVWCPSCNGRYCGIKIGNSLIPGRINCYCDYCSYDYQIWDSEIQNGNDPCKKHG